MHMTMRWFGPADPVPLWKLRQVPNLTGIVSALHDVPPGEAWTADAVALRADVAAHDLPAQARRFAPHVHLVHARNVLRRGGHDFDEVPHISSHGRIDLARTVMTLARTRPGVPIRPDLWRMIWGETGRPGYGLYDRALGATYLQGLIDAATLEDTHA